MTEPVKPTPEEVWREILKEGQECREVWGMGFPVISLFLLRKHFKKLTGWEPPDK